MAVDCLIVGGGVIGLSLAWELASAGQRVRVIDRNQPGQQASWAGAGMLPPGVEDPTDTPLNQFHGLSYRLHAEWTERLRALTGLDNGYRRTGAVYIARDTALRTTLTEHAKDWSLRNIAAELLDETSLRQCEPALNPVPLARNAALPLAYYLPGEAQIRNPRHVRALIAACTLAGVEISAGVEAEDFVRSGSRVSGVVTGNGVIEAGQVCLTAGSWTGRLARRCGLSLAVRPVRGQMVLLREAQCSLKRIVNEGSRYLVPRGDGLVLVGSTEEEAGFEINTTTAGIAGLLEFAHGLAPSLAVASLERSWAGLRPGSPDGIPYLGQAEGFDNLFVAAGHYRAGLLLSPATAVIMRQLMLGQPPQFDLRPCGLNRL